MTSQAYASRRNHLVFGPADASVGCQQDGQGAAGRYQHLQSGAGLPGHRSAFHCDHGSDFCIQLDRLLLRLLAIQRICATAHGQRRRQNGGRRVLEPYAVLRQRARAARRRRV